MTQVYTSYIISQPLKSMMSRRLDGESSHPSKPDEVVVRPVTLHSNEPCSNKYSCPDHGRSYGIESPCLDQDGCQIHGWLRVMTDTRKVGEVELKMDSEIKAKRSLDTFNQLI